MRTLNHRVALVARRSKCPRLVAGIRSFSASTPGERIASAATSLVVAALAGVGIAFMLRRNDRVPAAVSALCMEAAELAQDAPLSAAAKYERALALLRSAGDVNPLYVAELLTLWGDAQFDGRQLSRARDTFVKAEQLLAALRMQLSPAVVLANDLHRKHALVHDRLASVGGDMGEPRATRLRHLLAALEAIESRRDDSGGKENADGRIDGHTRLLIDSFGAGNRGARFLAADCAGIYFNRSTVHLEEAQAALSGADHAAEPAVSASAAVRDAFCALRLVEAARSGCIEDARRALFHHAAASVPHGATLAPAPTFHVPESTTHQRSRTASHSGVDSGSEGRDPAANALSCRYYGNGGACNCRNAHSCRDSSMVDLTTCASAAITFAQFTRGPALDTASELQRLASSSNALAAQHSGKLKLTLGAARDAGSAPNGVPRGDVVGSGHTWTRASLGTLGALLPESVRGAILPNSIPPRPDVLADELELLTSLADDAASQLRDAMSIAARCPSVRIQESM